LQIVRYRALPESKRNLLPRGLNLVIEVIAILKHMVLRRRASRYDVAVVSTMPPVLIAAARLSCALTGAKVIYHVMDIYPEVAIVSGMAKEGLLTRCLRAIDRGNCAGADVVVVLSDDMRDTIAGRGISTANVRVLNNFQLESFGSDGHLPDGLEKPEGCFRVLFAGNIGRFQGLDTVIEAFAALDDLPGLRLDILGDGVAREELQRQAGERLSRRIFFHGYHPAQDAARVIATADLGLVTLSPGMYRVAYPSKTMSYLAMASPLLVMVEDERALARMVRSEGVGYQSPQGDAAALARSIRRAYGEPERLKAMRTKALRLAEREFATEVALERWVTLFGEME